jgi:hypothetical protein
MISDGSMPISRASRSTTSSRCENGVVGNTGKQGRDGIRVGDRRSKGSDQDEQRHRVDQAEERDREDRDEGAQTRQEAGDDGGPSRGQEERECGRTERSLRQDIKDKAPDKGPHESALEPGRHGPDDAEHEDKVRIRVSDTQVRDDGQFDQCSRRRADRCEKEAHPASILGRRARGRAPETRALATSG